MRVLVTGAAGQLGRSIAREFNLGHEVLALGRADLDIEDATAVRDRVEAFQPALIVNCAAYNEVDRAEDEPARALSINGLAPGALAVAANSVDAVLVHYSTDFVFDGEAAVPYSEDDVPRPKSMYAMSKLMGEWGAAIARRHYVLRVESLFGGGADAPSHTRRGSTIDRMADTLIAARELRVFVDRVVSPSYVTDVTFATAALVTQQAPYGLYHCVNSGMATWQELAIEMARQMDVEPHIVGVHTSEVRLKAPRPRFCALANAKLAACGIEMPTWRDALARYTAGRRALEATVAPRALGRSATESGTKAR
jgi:dTDP-4-dehydrorhamnose reductase